jgi:hypothetical protein
LKDRVMSTYGPCWPARCKGRRMAWGKAWWRLALRAGRVRAVIAFGAFAMVSATSVSAWADEPAAPSEPAPLEGVDAAAGTGFYPTATYGNTDVPPRPVDAGETRECDRDDPRTRHDPRCDEVRAESSSSMNSPALVVVGGALTVVGALGVAGGVALAGYESGDSGAETSLNCRAGESGVGCDPSVDSGGAVDVLATVGGVGLVVVSGAIAITGVTLVVIGAVPKDDEPQQPSVQLSVAPARVSLGGTF